MTPASIQSTSRKKILFIEREEHHFTPLAIIPPKYVRWLLPYAGAYYESDSRWDLLSQVFRLSDMNIWGHHIFAHSNFILAPFPSRHIIALHFMHTDSIIADIKDNGMFALAQRQANLFSLQPVFHSAILRAGQHIFSFHINVSMDTLSKLALEFAEIATLSSKTVGDGSGALNQVPVTINRASRRLIMEIIGCRYVEQQAEYLLRRCCINLFCHFSVMEADSYSDPLSQDLASRLDASFDYLATQFRRPYDGHIVARKFHLSEEAFRSGFLQLYGLYPEAFLAQERFILSYHLLLQTRKRYSTIAGICGFTNVDEFHQSFEQYFKCSPECLRNAQ